MPAYWGVSGAAATGGSPPTFVAASSGTGSTSASATAPTGTQANDIITAIVVNRAEAEPSTPLAGYTLKDSQTTTGLWTGWYWRRASGTSADDASFSGATNSCVLGLCSYRGCITTGDPMDVFNKRLNLSAPSGCDQVTTTLVNTRIVGMIGCWDNRNYADWAVTSPGALTEDLEVLNATGDDTGCGVASAPWNGSGATGALTLSMVFSSNTGFLFALKPTA